MTIIIKEKYTTNSLTNKTSYNTRKTQDQTLNKYHTIY